MRFGLILFFSLSLVLPYTLHGQNSAPDLPESYTLFYSNYSSYNPASMGAEYTWRLDAGTRVQPGPWLGIYNIYAHGHAEIGKRSPYTRGPSHFLGALFQGDREGELISRNRFYAQYAVKLELNKDWHMSAGTSVGLVNYGIKETNISFGGSAFAFDLGIGIWFFSETISVGASMNQLPTQELAPINEIRSLSQYLNLNGEYRWLINPRYSLISAAMMRWSPDGQVKTLFDLHSRIVYDEKISLGFSAQTQRGMGILVGMERIMLGLNPLTVRVNYNVALGKDSARNFNTFELSFTYGLKNETKPRRR